MIVRPLAPVFPKRAAEPRATARRARSARNAVLWGVAVLVAANLGLAAALETVAPQLRDPEYGYRLVRARAQQKLHPGRPLVVVMGTSRTANGFNPAAINGSGGPLLFNFGLAGGGPLHLRSRLGALRENGVTPHAVAVELFLASLALDATSDMLCKPTAPRLSAADLRRLEPQLADPAALRREWMKARLNPWQAQRLVLVSHVAPELLPWSQRIDHYWGHTNPFGFDAYPENKADEQRPKRLATVRGSYQILAREVRVGPHADGAIRGLVADCRAAGTPVCFFTTPESPEFRSWYSPESRARLDAYLRTLTTELGCPVFAGPDDYAETDFADGHHMLPHAAARFSRHLTEKHLGPWLASLPTGGQP